MTLNFKILNAREEERRKNSYLTVFTFFGSSLSSFVLLDSWLFALSIALEIIFVQSLKQSVVSFSVAKVC